MISIVIPANNEERYIGACLEALLAQQTTRDAQVIVAANACTDKTVDIADGFADRFAAKGWHLDVLDIAQGGKPNALNQADAAAVGEMRAYLDADVKMSPPLLEELAQALTRDDPAYASGQMTVSPATSWITRAYGRIWTKLPFMTDGVPGAGLFAVNKAGRARWGDFPQIISDDTFVRLQFTPAERIGVPAPYDWPLPEGASALVRVRRRQDEGVRELERLHPGILDREGKDAVGAGFLLRLGLRDPVGLVVYIAIKLATRTRQSGGWSRGR